MHYEIQDISINQEHLHVHVLDGQFHLDIKSVSWQCIMFL